MEQIITLAAKTLWKHRETCTKALVNGLKKIKEKTKQATYSVLNKDIQVKFKD